MAAITPPPKEKLGDTPSWLFWFQSIYSMTIAVDNIPKYPTAKAPTYANGRCYFDTTLNKLRIGGATAWETVTSI
jgi:hypothetical protein